MKTKFFITRPGSPHPLGTTIQNGGVNFAIFSQHATSVELLLFDKHDDPEPIQVIPLDMKVNKTFHFWHVFVEKLKPGMHYAYRIDGPHDLSRGHRFNENKVLIDPYSKGNTNNLWDRVRACGPEDNLDSSLRSVIPDSSTFDWEGDRPLNRPISESVIYEMHIGGFSKHRSSGVEHPGTFKGVIEKVPYLKELGVTAVELLPVFEFDDKEVLRIGADGKPLYNYWGYSTVSFFAPHKGYCLNPETGAHLNEFREMVKALHKAGIEVILDVVFNHTSEGNHQGPTINFRGIDNEIYYHLVENDKQYYMDYSGCGNTLNCNHPIVQKMIVECLEFWVGEMHVDGFRFDEGSILSRGQDGVPMEYPPVIWSIELSEILADSKIIAEAWDAAGCYQIGYFPGYRWAEWNGKFRDDIRRFVKGDPGVVGVVASRISGSSDIYQATGHLPINSINFVNCHDGFTLNDLVSFNEKHNLENGEGNNDGINENLSWNCGVEGPTDNAEIEHLRNRQIKNFATILMLSRGVPMFVMGDEIRRTQNGNNNAYCQDNEISWMDWSLLERNKETYHFFRKIIEFRKTHPILHLPRFFSGDVNSRGLKDISWHGTRLNSPGWNDTDARALAFTLGGFDGDPDMHVMMNMYWDNLEFDIPVIPGRKWYEKIDTSEQSPCDVADQGSEKLCSGNTLKISGRSIVVLVSK
ncbi:MAG: glycogen debranching protein GlgX [Thermodesulfobacteriota bacterium]